MAELQLAGFLADLVHGEVHNPAEGVLLLVHVTGDGGAQSLYQRAGGLLGSAQLAGGQGHEVVGLQTQGRDHRLLDGLDKLGDAAHNLTVLVQAEPVGLAAGDHLHIRQGLVDELPGLVEIADHHGLHHVALEGAEAAGAQQAGDVLHRQVDAQVRLVGAILLHGLGVRDTHEGRGAGPVVFAVLGKDGGQHVLQYGKYVILRGKGHLHVQLVKLTGGAVRPGVLVPKAGGDLEVPVKAGGHQQLLELLGCLRQGIELSGVVPGGHQIVPGTLRGGGGQDGGGDLQEAMLCHGLPQGGHYLAPEDDVVLHRRVPQVQIAVLQAGGLVGLPAAVDGERQLVVLAAAQHLNFAGHHLDLAGGQLGVLAVPLPDGALHGDGGLLVDGLQQGHHVGGLRHHLSGAIEVPDHGEGQLTAYLPEVFQPAADLYGLAGVGEPQLSAGMGAILCHDCGFLSVWKCDYK